MARGRKRALGLVSLIVSGGLIAFLLSRIDSARALEVIGQAQPRWLFVAMIATCFIPLTAVVRWRGVLKAQGDLALPFFVTLRAVMLANVLNSFLPSKAGDLAKAAYLRRQGGLSRGVGTIVLERLIDLAVLGSLGIVGYLKSGAAWGILAGAILIGGVTVAFFCIRWLPVHRLPLPAKVKEKITSARSVFERWSSHGPAIVQTLAGSLATWSLGGITVFALARGFGTDLTMGYAYAIFPLALLAGLLPVTISGIGTRDSAFVALLVSQMPVEEATLVGIGYTLFAYWFLSLLSLPIVGWEIVRYNRSAAGDEETVGPAQ
jgi:uncharacterized membrane protein YbhN (UPF0104 family)